MNDRRATDDEVREAREDDLRRALTEARAQLVPLALSRGLRFVVLIQHTDCHPRGTMGVETNARPETAAQMLAGAAIAAADLVVWK